jgi:hypothetical protein
MPYSIAVKPVALPPGRAKLSILPLATGSMTPANTMGTLRLACCNARTKVPWLVTTTSGASATNSAA